MAVQTVFKRFEIKYLLNREQYQGLKELMSLYMNGDDFGNTTICNIYYDTESSEVIRRSIEKPLYKEKLRVRSYGVAKKDTKVFVELKKKFEGIVYKRRISMTNTEVDHLMNGDKTTTNQIAKEIKYYKSNYQNLVPAMYIAYNREAFFAKENHEFRMTFDQDITYRNYDLNLESDIYGDKLLEDGQILLEVKTGVGFPIWLKDYLSANQLYKTSFSKYGNIYKETYQQNNDYLQSLEFLRKREYSYAKLI
jgi:hypothetical protein